MRGAPNTPPQGKARQYFKRRDKIQILTKLGFSVNRGHSLVGLSEYVKKHIQLEGGDVQSTIYAPGKSEFLRGALKFRFR